MLDCGKNPLLKKLEEAENALQDKLAQLETLGAGALDDILSAASDMEDALKAAIPEIPKIPNFQEEIDKLIAKAKAADPKILQQLQELENQWGHLVPNIQDTLEIIKNPAKLLNFNLCNDVPKVEAKVAEDGSLVETPTTIDVVENIGPAPEQPAPEPAPLPADEVERTADAPASPSQFTRKQAKKALKEMIKAEKAFMKELDEEFADSVGNYNIDEDSRNSNRYSLANQVETAFANKVPNDWKLKNPDGTVYDYYLLHPEVKVDQYVDRLARAKAKQYAYQDMKTAISLYNIRVMNTLRKRPDKNNRYRWVNGDFNPQYKEELQQIIYYDLGYGIREYHPEYGFGFRKELGLRESSAMVPSSFRFKEKDYKANFTPRCHNLTQMRSGQPPTHSNPAYSNMIADYVNNLFDAKVKIKGVMYNAALVMISYTQDVALDDIKDAPTAKDFIPTTLGGNLPPWEDVLLGTVTREEFLEQLRHSEENFQPHFMYKVSVDGTKYVTQYANTYQEHMTLANLGYTHQLPQ